VNPFADQAAFMQACGQTIDQFNPRQANLYAELIREEHEEFKDAMAEYEKADAVIDLIVVLIGYGLSKGWPMERLWAEVNRSNMAKVDAETGMVKRRHDGKILKPDGWTPPNLRAIIEE